MPNQGKRRKSPSLPIKKKSVPSATPASTRRIFRTSLPNSCPSRVVTKKSGCAGPCATAKSCRPTSAPPSTRSLPMPMKNRTRPNSATASACANTPVPAARPAATTPTPNLWPRSAASSTKKKFPGRSGNWVSRPRWRWHHRYIMADWGCDVVDCGVAMHSMHAPLEIVAKADAYSGYLAYKAFLK